jgi:hypothetical protein
MTGLDDPLLVEKLLASDLEHCFSHDFGALIDALFRWFCS